MSRRDMERSAWTRVLAKKQIIRDFVCGEHRGKISLLKINKEQGREKKPHCDDMDFECVALVEEILKEKGKI